MFGNVVFQAWNIYQYVETPAEYIVTDGEIFTDGRIDEFLQIKDIEEISREMEDSVTIKYNGEEAVITCTKLSSAYLKNVYGIEGTGGMKRFYMNEAAFREFKQSLLENDTYIEERDGTVDGIGNIEYTVRYLEQNMTLEGAGDAERSFKSAKIVVVKSGLSEEQPFICTVDDSSEMSKQAVSVQVRFDGHDLDGLHVKSLKRMGCSLVNETEVLVGEYEMKIRLLHIRYGLLSSLICMVGACALWHMVKKSVL